MHQCQLMYDTIYSTNTSTSRIQRTTASPTTNTAQRTKLMRRTGGWSNANKHYFERGTNCIGNHETKMGNANSKDGISML